MDYEHQPTPGPTVWIGAGLLAAVGGGALLWVVGADSSDPVPAVAGWVMVTAGLASAVAGIVAAVRRRQ